MVRHASADLVELASPPVDDRLRIGYALADVLNTPPSTMQQDLKKTLWAAADKLRSSMDAAEYKHIVLGLIFLKY
jgi:hypothetical protein